MFSVVDNEAGHSGNAALIDSVVVSLADITSFFLSRKFTCTCACRILRKVIYVYKFPFETKTKTKQKPATCSFDF